LKDTSVPQSVGWWFCQSVWVLFGSATDASAGVLCFGFPVSKTEVKVLTYSEFWFCSFKRALNRWISAICICAM